MKFPEFVALVEGWAKERKIIPNATPTAQLLKAASEVGELADGVNKRDIDAIKDAIGDVAVCLVNWAALVGENANDAFEVAQALGSMDVEMPNDEVFRLMDFLSKMHFESDYEDRQVFFEWSFCALMDLSEMYGLEFMDCCESAWNEIKDRKGELRADGVFVKESELNKE